MREDLGVGDPLARQPGLVEQLLLAGASPAGSLLAALAPKVLAGRGKIELFSLSNLRGAYDLRGVGGGLEGGQEAGEGMEINSAG